MYQHFSDPTGLGNSPWWTGVQFNPDEAIQLLALPNDNTATNWAIGEIPAGTWVIIAEVSNQSSTYGFPPTAVGGGFQVYTPDPSVVNIVSDGP